MNELKTLKDLPGGSWVARLSLRQLAIKWIKQDIEIGKKIGMIKDKPKFGQTPNEYNLMLLRWMLRFNITEEDLK